MSLNAKIVVMFLNICVFEVMIRTRSSAHPAVTKTQKQCFLFFLPKVQAIRTAHLQVALHELNESYRRFAE